jgi:hypothetical protein
MLAPLIICLGDGMRAWNHRWESRGNRPSSRRNSVLSLGET